ncbi:hypothetical protein QLG09_17260 [Enterobacter sp. V89_11]|uniref:hypothetical protein n=1 Tax=Enterobacter sp. V89_11 TaxID=3044237 RepID=UPI00249F3A1A|nr:hypothetical protein [Enterobacter sp. V89_11]MDI3450593.1 hypothetical protein [Enterobacter sp. V89_11]HDC4524085.1 hypothetical protein [Enterobacter kobei]
MQPYERLTSERLASLPEGSRLKLGGQIIKLTGRGSFTNSAGRTENMIEYVDSRGVPGSFAESIILDSATEHLSSVMCAYCGARRHKSDCTVQTVSTYMSTAQKHFCTDKGCAEKFFRQNPSRAKTSRRTRW